MSDEEVSRSGNPQFLCLQNTSQLQDGPAYRSRYAAMPGLVRKLVIFAIADGLILQPYGAQFDQPQALRLEWKTSKLTPWKTTTPEQYKDKPHVESHGIVGKSTTNTWTASASKHCVPD